MRGPKDLSQNRHLIHLTSPSSTSLKDERSEVRQKPVKSIKIYNKQAKGLREMHQNLKRMHALPSSKVEVYKLSLNELLEFFDDEKQRLDLVWSQLTTQSPAMRSKAGEGEAHWQKMQDRSSQVSSQLSALNARALEESVEIDLVCDDLSVDEAMDPFGHNERNSFFRSTRPLPEQRLSRYHDLVETILTQCHDYHELTEEAIQKRRSDLNDREK